MQNFAIVFPGQGSQSVGMLAEISETSPIIATRFSKASEILGFDLWQVCQQGPEQLLNQTQITQPAMLVADVALYDLFLAQNNKKPDVVAGHSLGEYAALVAAEVITFADAVKVVAKRAELMVKAMENRTGSMAAIVGLSDEQVSDICERASQGESLSPANYNSIGQVAIAGDKSAVLRAIVLAEAMEARLAKEIPVSVPCHCALMRPATKAFADFLDTIHFHAPKIPVIFNVTAQPCQDVNEIKKLLVQQLDSPVQWVKTIQGMIAQGVNQILECGPGKVLTGLNKRIDRSLTYANVMEQMQCRVD